MVLLAAAAVAACGGPTNPKPTVDVTTDSLMVWSMTGTLGIGPAGYELATNGVVLVDNQLLLMSRSRSTRCTTRF